MKSFADAISRWKLLLSVILLGRWRLPGIVRRSLQVEQRKFRIWIKDHYMGMPWRVKAHRYTLVQPFVDLLNRPAGGEAYFGGVVFDDPNLQPGLHHFRGFRAIDRPLTELIRGQSAPIRVSRRQFWCGPLAFHFGHQIADFGSRVLVASIDPRDGDLLWCPWRSGHHWDKLLPWQQFLLSYLNPGGKYHRICSSVTLVKELIVVPQQARMHSAPTPIHLEALCWCERSLESRPNRIVYVSRSRFAACTNADNLLGAYAGESLFELMLLERGVKVVHPEFLPLKEQIEIYYGAESIIVAEGSSQHGLELLGFHGQKRVVVICRRPQIDGMALPLYSRFPKIRFVNAVKEQWKAVDGVAWNGLALLEWSIVAKNIDSIVNHSLSNADCLALEKVSNDQLQALSEKLPIIPV